MRRYFKNSYVLTLILLYTFAYAGMGVHHCAFDGTTEYTLQSEELTQNEHTHHHDCHCEDGHHHHHIHTFSHECDEHCENRVHFHQSDCCSLSFYVLTDSQNSSNNVAKIYLSDTPVIYSDIVESIKIVSIEQQAILSQITPTKGVVHQSLLSIWRL